VVPGQIRSYNTNKDLDLSTSGAIAQACGVQGRKEPYPIEEPTNFDVQATPKQLRTGDSKATI
jgi:hypothetical protein